MRTTTASPWPTSSTVARHAPELQERLAIVRQDLEHLAQVSGRARGLTEARAPQRGKLPVELGRTAVLESAGTRIIATETCQSPNDPGYFALHGIDLTAIRLLCVKAKNHFRAAFGPQCSTIVEVDAPGPASPDLSRYRFRHVPKELLSFAERRP